MRRALTILYVLPLTLCLAGCGSGSMRTDRTDIERLMLIQTMGLDRKGEGVEMSVSSGLGPEDRPALVMTAAASGMEAAIQRLQAYSPENQLFYGHVQYLLLGEEAAKEDLQAILAWVDRSPVMRMGTAMLIVKGSAVEAVEAASGEATDITARLASLERGQRARGQDIHSLREVAGALANGQGALCLAVETTDAEDEVLTQDKQAAAVVPVGCAVLGPDGLVDFLTPEQSLGAELLTGRPVGTLVSVDGAALELLSCETEVSGRFDENGALTGLAADCTVRAGLLEKPLDHDESSQDLDGALAQAVRGWIAGAVEKAQTLGCDFLDLRTAAMDGGSDRALRMEAWPEIFPALPVTVTVNAAVDRSYDLSE